MVQGDDSLIEKTVCGYRIEALICRGSRCDVYRAEQLAVERKVALKFLSPRSTIDRKSAREFVKGARLAAGLSHPRIVQIHNVHQQDDLIFYSMEYMAGGSLADLVSRDGRLRWRTAAILLSDAAAALLYAERQGTAHGAVNPTHLLLGEDGRVKLANLGFTRHSPGRMPGGASCLSSIQFQSPEQIARGKSGLLTDIYALGCTSFHALTGNPPFAGERVEEILASKETRGPPEVLAWVKGAPEWLNALIARMMARDPEGRPRSFLEILEELKRHLEPGADRPRTGKPSPAAVRKAWSRKRRVVKSIAAPAAAILALAAAAIAAVWLVFPGMMPGPGIPEEQPEFPSAVTGEISSIAKASLDDEKSGNALAGIEKNPNEPRQPEIVEPADGLKGNSRDLQRAGNLLKMVEEVDRNLESGNYREAIHLLDAISKEYPEKSADISDRQERARGAARAALEQASEEARRLALAEDFREAGARLARISPKLPDDLLPAAEEETSRIQAIQENLELHAGIFQEPPEALKMRLLRGDFSGALEAVALPEENLPERYRLRAKQLQEEIELCSKALERILSGLEGIANAGSRLELGFAQGSLTGARFQCRLGGFKVEEIGDVRLTLHRIDGKTETCELLDLDEASLLGLLRQIGALDGTDVLAVPVVEGVGLLLYYRRGAARAWDLLTRNPRFPEHKSKAYADRLAKAARGEIARELDDLRKRLTAAGKQKGKPSTSDLSGLLIELERLIARDRKLGHYEEFREKVSNLYIDVYKERALADGVEKLFCGSFRTVSGGGVVLTYDFSSEKQLEDLVRIEGEAPRIDRGVLILRGEYRLKAGNPFKNWMRVTASVRDYDPGAPNLNIALWTHDGDRLTPKTDPSSAGTGSPRSAEPAPAEFLVFAAGYRPSSTSNNSLSVRDTGETIPFPCYAVLCNRQDNAAGGSSGVDPLICLWATGMIIPPRGPQELKLTLKPDFFEWTLGANRIHDWTRRKNPQWRDRLEKRGSTGSLTLFTNGKDVSFRKFVVETELNQDWLVIEARRRAELRFQEIESKASASTR